MTLVDTRAPRRVALYDPNGRMLGDLRIPQGTYAPDFIVWGGCVWEHSRTLEPPTGYETSYTRAWALWL